MPKIGINSDDLKRKNRGMAIRLVATEQSRSRIELSKKTGLTKAAISQIVNELIHDGFLVETKSRWMPGKEPGRKPVLLEISGDAPKSVGILIQRKYGEAVLCDLQSNILKYERIDREWTSADELMEAVYTLIDRVTKGVEHLAGIGVASIGPVNVNEGKIIAPFYFNGIQNVNVKKLLEERYHLPVYVDHDNQSAALVEKLFGNGKEVPDLLMVGIGVGVGCGIIINNERYQSGSGYTPEIGHVSIDYNGRQCLCGNRGCLEMYIRSETVLNRLQGVTGSMCSYREFCEQTQDPLVDQIFCDIIDKMTIAIVSVQNMLNSDMVILGQDAVYWPDKYIRLLEDKINERKFSNRETRTLVAKPYFMEKTYVLGAACNVLSKLFHGEMPIPVGRTEA